MTTVTSSFPQTVTYSDAIGPEDFIRINTNERPYLRQSDLYIKSTISEVVLKFAPRSLEIVEIGCGPARLLRQISEIRGIHLTGVDDDEGFLTYCRNQVLEGTPTIRKGKAENYQHLSPVDLFYSQGLHHHLVKPPTTYLNNLRSQLSPGGLYLVSDTFLSYYTTEEERKIKSMMWHSHIIASALREGFDFLAREEARNLLADLGVGRHLLFSATEEKIETIINHVGEIDIATRRDQSFAKKVSEDLMQELLSDVPDKQSLRDKPRQPHKTSEEVFKQEIEEAGFAIISAKSFGPINTIGGISVFTLQSALN